MVLGLKAWVYGFRLPKRATVSVTNILKALCPVTKGYSLALKHFFFFLWAFLMFLVVNDINVLTKNWKHTKLYIVFKST